MSEIFDRIIFEKDIEELTLKKYQQETKIFFDELNDYFYKNDEISDTIFYIEAVYKPNLKDKNSANLPDYSRIFKSIRKMKDYIMLIEDCLSEWIEHDYENDDLNDYYCWKIDAYKADEEKDFQNSFTVWADTFGHIFNVMFGGYYNPKNTEEELLFEKWYKLNHQGKIRLKFAYEVGDIIQVNKLPFENAEYYIYADKENNQVLFLDNGKLRLKRLFNRYSYGFEPLLYQVVDECPVPELKKPQEILKIGTEENKKKLFKTVEEG